MGITTMELAKLCGVSRGTIDRVLNNRPGVNPETKRRVIKVAAHYNYRIDISASSLSKGRTHTIGLVLFDLHNRFFAQMADEFVKEARRNGYFVYLTLTNQSKELEMEYIDQLLNKRVDGIVLCSICNGSEYKRLLETFMQPVITIGNKLFDYPCVGINDRLAASDAVDYITSEGYESVIYYCPALENINNSNIYTQKQRYAGFLESAKRNKIDFRIAMEGNAGKTLEMASARDLKTAVLCSDDIYALEVLKACGKAGIRVPQDMGIMGFDNIDTLQFIRPKISTVDHNINQMAKSAFRLILEMQDDSSAARNIILPHRIVYGSSI